MPQITTLFLQTKEDNFSSIKRIATVVDELASFSRNMTINISVDDTLLFALEYTHLDFDEALFQELAQTGSVANATQEAYEQYEVFLHNFQDKPLPFEAPLNTISYAEVAQHFQNTINTLLKELKESLNEDISDFFEEDPEEENKISLPESLFTM